ncbi:hypothetical protein [Saccharibacillus alkalitolerans]|uniref:Uncharacterized protein n=1 Tax=Saccharibacillus alkalitolerans TaxID=2705290 RepID=A0ABX0F8T5_9BACL|nr:hypothetical protein [Saccharibacillus alkalitolerans]NGZ76723.1 hypothetical protein [Saccharibacillus alkalitolerans]
MIGFNTVLPLSNTVSEEQFLELCRTWQKNSPHTSLIIKDETLTDGFKYQSDSESLEFVNVEGKNGTHCGVRHIKKDEDSEWRTDVIGYKTESNFKVAVVTSRATFNVANYTRLPLKPFIVSLLLENLELEEDDGIKIEKKFKEITSDNLEYISCLLNGEQSNSFPVVYLSKNKSGEFLVDPNKLALKLSGLAHVFVETEESITFMLQKNTDGKVAYNGQIGIYWPGGDRNYYYRIDATDHVNNILNFVKKILNTRKTPNEYRWSFVQNLKYQKTIEGFKTGEEENKDMLAYALEENEKLKEQLDNMELENLYLNHMNEVLNSNAFNGQTPLIFKGTEYELFLNEQSELVLSLVEEKMNQDSCSIRVKNILNSILKANKNDNNKQRFLDNMKRILVSQDGITSRSKRELATMGFELIDYTKTHHKIKIKGDNRYSHSIAKSPSDARTPENNFRDFKIGFL